MVSSAIIAQFKVRHTCHSCQTWAPTSSSEEFCLLRIRLCTPHNTYPLWCIIAFIHAMPFSQSFLHQSLRCRISIGLCPPYVARYMKLATPKWNFWKYCLLKPTSNIRISLNLSQLHCSHMLFSSIGSQTSWTITLHLLLNLSEMHFFSSCCYAMACRCELLICNYNCIWRTPGGRPAVGRTSILCGFR